MKHSSARELVRAYTDGTIKDAKNEIIRHQKEIAAEKKQVRALTQKYKPQIRLYEELSRYARQAYLYEMEEAKEYVEEYLIYQKLLSRLLTVYQKTPEDVAGLLSLQKAQLLYLQAQKEELSAQYKALTKYEQRCLSKPVEETESSLFAAIGHTEALLEAKKYNILTKHINHN